MSISKSEEIKEIEELKIKEEYSEALDKIDSLLQNKESTKIEKIQAKILECEVIWWFSDIAFDDSILDKVLVSANEALKEAEEEKDLSLIFDATTWKTYFLFMTGKYKECIEVFEQLEGIKLRLKSIDNSEMKEKNLHLLLSEVASVYAKTNIVEDYTRNNEELVNILKNASEIAKELEDKKWLSFTLSQIGGIYRNIGNMDKSIEFINEAVKVAEDTGNDYWRFSCLMGLAQNYLNLGEYDNSLNYIKEMIKIAESKDNEKLKAWGKGAIGVYNSVIGDYKNALDNMLESRKILSENERIETNAWLGMIASTHYNLGNVEEALKFYMQFYENLKKRGYPTHGILSNIAKIYTHKGDLDKALNLYEQALDQYNKTGNKLSTAFALKSISEVYDKKGISNKALEYLEESLKIFEEIGSKVYSAIAIYELIVLTIRYENLELAEKYFNKLENSLKDIELKNIKRLILIAEGLILKNSDNFEERIRAEVLFDQLLQEELSYEYKIEILLQLSDLLLLELKRTSNERYLEKLQKTISKLIEIGTENDSSQIIIECLWFNSQLSLLNLDVDKARELLNLAFDTAERKGFNQLALKVTKSKEQLIKQKIELETLEKNSPTISKRMEVVKVENGFKELKSKEAFEFKVSEVESSKKLFSLQI